MSTESNRFYAEGEAPVECVLPRGIVERGNGGTPLVALTDRAIIQRLNDLWLKVRWAEEVAKPALTNIRSKTVPLGHDSGDAGVAKVAEDALAAYPPPVEEK